MAASNSCRAAWSRPTLWNWRPEIQISGRQFHSQGLDQAARQEFDAAVILVNHSYFDWAEVVKNNQLVIDAVDATRSLGPQPNVVKL